MPTIARRNRSELGGAMASLISKVFLKPFFYVYFLFVGLIGLALAVLQRATGGSPCCDTSRVVLVNPSSTHISQENLIISSGCRRGSSLHFSPWHYSTTVPGAGDSICGKRAFQTTLPVFARSKPARYFVQFETGYSEHCPAVCFYNHLIIKRFIYQIQRTESP